MVFKLQIICLLTGLLNANAERVSVAKAMTSVIAIVEMPQTSEPVPPIWRNQFSFPSSYTITTESDFDSDGLPDYLEYYAGSDPTDGTSLLKIVETNVIGDDIFISWLSSTSNFPASRQYILFRSGEGHLSDLANASTISELENNPGITKIGPIDADQLYDVTSYTDPDLVDQTPLFYRIFLSQPLPTSN